MLNNKDPNIKDSEKLFKLGIRLTQCYFIGIGFLIITNFKIFDIFTMDLNNLGDFLAGLFGPVAFLWLVIGYRQQAIEIRQNTAALNQQVQELNASVQQQKELVQIERENLVILKDRIASEAENKPRFVIIYIKYSGMKSGKVFYEVKISNQGRNCFNTEIKISFCGKIFKKDQPKWAHGSEISHNFERQKTSVGSDLTIDISCFNDEHVPLKYKYVSKYEQRGIEGNFSIDEAFTESK